MITMTTTPAVPTQRCDPGAVRSGPREHAAQLMRRLWASDPDTADELVAGLADLSRIQLGRVIDNLLWTLANQPRAISADQMRRIRLLWGTRMSRPIDASAERRLAGMTEDEAQKLIRRMSALPERQRV